MSTESVNVARRRDVQELIGVGFGLRISAESECAERKYDDVSKKCSHSYDNNEETGGCSISDSEKNKHEINPNRDLG